MNPKLDWQRRYEENDTPWDQGAAAPPLLGFLRERPVTGRVLVPGCGRGHEARALGLQPQAAVVGVDLSPLAVAQAGELTPGAPAGRIAFVAADFFDLPAAWKESFDWVVEHTCFCAIEPRRRPDYVRAAAEALKPGGRLLGIFFLNPDVASGPPFAVSPEELDGLFEPRFLLLEEWTPRESFPGREGRERVRLLQKR